MKMKALDSLRKKFKSDLLSDKDLAPMEVTVGADSEEGLEEGLEMAKEVVGKGTEELPMLGEDDDLETPEMELEEEANEIVEKLKSSPELMEKILSKLSL